MSLNRRIIRKLDRVFYPDLPPRWDDELFRREVRSILGPRDVVLDIGAGTGRIPQTNFRGCAARVCGVDLDESVLENPHLDEAKVGPAENLPYPDACFDAAFACNVMEHVGDPAGVFREIRRVLRPGGRFVAKTPNLHHYMATIARLTPHRFHEYVTSRIFTRTHEDTFPTPYRVNTARAVRRFAREAGLEVERIIRAEDYPNYMSFSVPTYLLGLLYQRIVTSVPGLDGLRIVLVFVLRRPE